MIETSQNLETAVYAAAINTPLLQVCGVSRICLFGSRAKETNRGNSDWDFKIDFFRPIRPSEFFRIKYALVDALGKGVHICSPQYSETNFICSIARDCRQIWPL